jgi:Na+-driven multidrug efflux pump
MSTIYPFILAILAYSVVRIASTLLTPVIFGPAETPAQANTQWLVSMTVSVIVAALVLFLAARIANRRQARSDSDRPPGR